MNQVTVEPYRRVLALPGVRALLIVGLLARIPVTATGMTLIFHVRKTLDLGYFEAGAVGAAATLGVAIGAPIAGRFVDRYGLRPVVSVTTAAQFAFWISASFVPYWVLLGGAVLAGVLSVPVFGVVRQCIAASVPIEQRRPAYALDGMFTEIAYMVGPAFAVAASTLVGTHWTMAVVGVGLVGSGVALYVLNPPTVHEEERAEAAVPRRQWLTPAMFALLGVTFAATFVLCATELGIVAALMDDGAENWTGLVIGLWCLWSLVGGFVYGGMKRVVSPLILVGGMAVLTIPLGLVGGWQWLMLALIPAGLLCAPALSTTADTVSQWVPGSARGEAMGLHGTALTLGLALSGPLTGWVIDAHGTSWAFVLAGAVGLVLAVVAVPFWRMAPKTVPVAESEKIAA